VRTFGNCYRKQFVRCAQLFTLINPLLHLRCVRIDTCFAVSVSNTISSPSPSPTPCRHCLRLRLHLHRRLRLCRRYRFFTRLHRYLSTPSSPPTITSHTTALSLSYTLLQMDTLKHTRTHSTQPSMVKTATCRMAWQTRNSPNALFDEI